MAKLGGETFSFQEEGTASSGVPQQVACDDRHPWVLPVGKRGHLKGLRQAGWSPGSKGRAGLSVPLNYSNPTRTHPRSTVRLLSTVWDGVWAADGSLVLAPGHRTWVLSPQAKGLWLRRTDVCCCCCFAVLAPAPGALTSCQLSTHFSRGLLPRPSARTHVWSDSVNSCGGKHTPGRAQPGRGCHGT